jgi:pimeloyl-ACP methyl ester carboxylesterase
VAVVFLPQAAPADYVERAAIKLLLRPRTFLANAHDTAGLSDFLAVQSRRYPSIKVPTIVVTGDSDTVVSVDIHSRAFAAAVPASKLVVLKSVGHMPHHVAAEAVVGAVEELAAMAKAPR